METIKGNYKSETYYKGITEVDYTPIYCFENQYLLHKRGEVKRKKIFGLTVYKKVYGDDVYFYDGQTETLSEILNDHWNRKFVKNGLVYRKAKVRVVGKDGVDDFHFEDDKSAKKFVQELIDNCRDAGNNLV